MAARQPMQSMPQTSGWWQCPRRWQPTHSSKVPGDPPGWWPSVLKRRRWLGSGCTPDVTGPSTRKPNPSSRRAGRGRLTGSPPSPAADGRDRLAGNLASAPVVMLGGGHSAHGDERDPFDLAGLTRALDGIDASVEAYAVAAQFSVRNAAHELQARDAIREHTGKPVTCSHELSPRLGGPRRAVTTLLNAQLISVTARFTEAIRAAMESLRLDARLMVVRGDGSLVSSEFVTKRPIETVLSGPAASVIGARHLARSSAADRQTLDAGGLVVDIGGTTADIAAVRNGIVVAADGSNDGRHGHRGRPRHDGHGFADRDGGPRRRLRNTHPARRAPRRTRRRTAPRGAAVRRRRATSRSGPADAASPTAGRTTTCRVRAGAVACHCRAVGGGIHADIDRARRQCRQPHESAQPRRRDHATPRRRWGALPLADLKTLSSLARRPRATGAQRSGANALR